ncbi:endolytic transglycosylase MltG [Alkalicella caledoniensis]|uniref:Endolytic murein transglycosylase n=1 Tax=Alkalicella caledoniensis TaxID=2731377 RepID=A0A7G9WBM4_ALKCA|nr:endolytic transglycosylase MltG [Alkalicella caledoniensis]QNO16086.1 endolytic transglycosylase MltG [Alkalicella caledoniensis]
MGLVDNVSKLAKNLLANMSNRAKVLLGIAIAILVVFITFSVVAYSQTLPPGKGENELTVDIPIGTSTVQVVNKLADNGLIKNKLLFRLYLRHNDYEGKFQAGSYQLHDGLSYGELAEILLSGQVQREGIRFTIPEGFKVEQIAERLENIGIADKEVFLNLVQNGEFDYWFINQIPQDVDYRLEGYLFPNTYEIHVDSTEWDIINVMLGQFNKVYNADFIERTEELELSVHEIVTLASIVEREAMVDKERPIIAGVFHNRLDINMLLQSCATIYYFTGREFILNSDTVIDHPYNTYKYPGLPPGPVGAPGAKSLESTLFYEDTDYLFFVTKKDGSSEHYFAKTYEEHRANDRKSRNN